MKVAIYIDNSSLLDVNCTDLTKGNPGIGGTEYCILLLAQMYKQYYSQHETVLFVEKQGKLPEVDATYIVHGVDSTLKKAAEINVDILVVSAVYKGKPLNDEFFEQLSVHNIKTITWGHNFYLSDFCDKLEESTNIRANVFVGRQQYDRYIDHKVIHKSTYIYNMYPNPLVKENTSNYIVNKNITYIGALVPLKGFHVLAKGWKKILHQVHDAQLYIIGSGKLYDENLKLGKYGIAEESYENKFMKYLLDDEGNILTSVHFLGVLGAEKDEIISKTAVGVVNPTGRTETFGISALDFESRSVPVVTIAKGGFLDTVVHKKTGTLYKNKINIYKAVVSLLKDTDRRISYGRNAKEFATQFDVSIIIKQWDALFKTVNEQKDIHYKKPTSCMTNNLKWLRYANRLIKNMFKVEYPISVIGLETTIRKLLRKIKDGKV